MASNDQTVILNYFEFEFISLFIITLHMANDRSLLKSY